MEKEFVRYPWEQYKEMLEKFNYNEEQIIEVQKIRENPEIEEITKDQFDFLVQTKIISRTRKLKKIRTLYTDGDKIYYLEHFNKRYEWCGAFVNEE